MELGDASDSNNDEVIKLRKMFFELKKTFENQSNELQKAVSNLKKEDKCP